MDYIEWLPKRVMELRTQRGVSARDMSLSLGQSESYINKIENGRTMPSIQGLLYICEYFSITPQEFFNTNAAAPQKSKELMGEIEKLTASQADHVIQIIRDITGKET
jgi:transcriptional regulator with XRE-family HTH domain